MWHLEYNRLYGLKIGRRVPVYSAREEEERKTGGWGGGG